MATEMYHETGKMSTLSNAEFIHHALEVIPGIVETLEAADVGIISVDINLVGERWARVHVSGFDIPNLIEWGKIHSVCPEILPHMMCSQAVYTVDGVDVFALLSDEEQERYFPN